MTGKEALNLLFCTSEGLPEDKVYECKKILEKELDELTKYKRAFEILKDKLKLRVEDITNNGAPALLVLFYNSNMETISVDEYELLEELMKSEKGN